MAGASQQSSPGSNGPSPSASDTKAIRAPRPTRIFTGCAKIAAYENLGKLGEGTFGYADLSSVISFQ